MNWNDISRLVRLLPPGYRPMIVAAIVGNFLSKTVSKVLPEQLDSFPFGEIRVAIRRGFERRVDRWSEVDQKVVRIVIPDNFPLACVAHALLLKHFRMGFGRSLNDLAWNLCQIGGIMGCLHQLRSFAFILGTPLLQSSSATAKYERLLKHVVPSDLVEKVEANVLHRETKAEVEAWQRNQE